mmetsp:Transcript_25116/g.59274  ORF Transcript_25116/g.59274 Transcript_25116/m.59274 type:complete len:347 (+) Transcript_25116:99-1139(+)
MTHEEQTKERSLPASISVTAGDIGLSKTVVKATPNERKGRATGLSSVIVLLILSTASIICGIYSFANCDFLTRNVTLSGDYASGGYTAACDDLNYDLQGEANDFQLEVCHSVMQPHGIGFVNWQSAVDGTDQESCFSYKQQMPWGKDRPVLDNAFGASRIFSIMGIIFGAFAWCTLTCNMLYMDQQRLKGMTCYYIVAAFFHGMSLLVFLSDVCEAGFFKNYLVPLSQRDSADGGPFDRVIDDVTVTCSRSGGANMAIGAVVLYILCDVIASCLVIPFYEEQCYRASYRAAEQRLGREKEQDATSLPTKASPPPEPSSIQTKSIQHKSSGRKPHVTSDERFFGNCV